MSSENAARANLAAAQRMYERSDRDRPRSIRHKILARTCVWNLPGKHSLTGKSLAPLFSPCLRNFGAPEFR